MSIFDKIFGNQAPAPAAPGTPAAPGNMPAAPVTTTVATPGTASNGVVPANGVTDPTKVDPNKVDSPLDQFKDLWEPVKTEEGKEPATPPQLDPEKLREVINKADFSSVIGKENLARIASGGEEAVGAFTESMNAVARQVMMQSTLASNKMIEQAVENALKAQESKFSSTIKQHTLTESLTSKNPLFKNPAIKPVLDAVRDQLAIKNPNASVAELTEMAQNFVKVMGEAMNPSLANIGDSSKNQDTDWDAFSSQ